MDCKRPGANSSGALCCPLHYVARRVFPKKASLSYSAVMFRASHPVLCRIAAAFIALQALWSSMAATAYAAGFDEAKYLCGTLAMELDAEARAQIAELVALTGLEEPQDHPSGFEPYDCVACALGHVAALVADAPRLAHRTPIQSGPAFLRVDQASPRTPTGPPVGLRAPPFYS